MTAQSWIWTFANTTGAAANSVSQALSITGTQHLRHVEVVGTITYQPYPTAVVGDNGILFGVVSRFPLAAPPPPSAANASSWQAGWWGRPVTDATELMYLTGGGTVPAVRWFFRVVFNYHTAGGGTAGGVYVGHQALYVDVNHALPNVSYTVRAWGYQE